MIFTSFGNDYISKNPPPNTRKAEPMLNFIVIVNSLNLPSKKTLLCESMEFLLKLAPGVKIWKM